MTTAQEETRRDVVGILSQLVACPSVNPGRRPPSGPPFGEERMAELLRTVFSRWGVEASVRQVSPGRCNFVARIAGKDSSRTLMFEAHSDTVQVEGMAVPPFEPTVRNGRLYGRGACDVKGPMAAMLSAIRTVLDEDGEPPTDLLFVSTCNEEGGGTGAYHLMAKGVRADAAVVAEPTDLAIVRAHKGIVRWAITTLGVAAHSAMPSQGVNAISKMGRVLERIDGRIAKSLRARHHPLLGEPTIIIGTIHGGTQANIVPATCTVEVDRRLLPSESREGATQQIRDELEALKAADETFDYRFEELECYPPFEEEENSPISRLVAGACRRVLGEATFATAPWGANSGMFKQAGIPCVLFGPGSIRQAHRADEYIELAQVMKAAEVYAEIIRVADTLGDPI